MPPLQTKTSRFLSGLRGADKVLDPMAGYGLLTQYCAEIGQRSYCVEFHLPQYCWQVLCHLAHAPEFIKCLRQLQAWRPRWPKATVRAIASDTWFPEKSQRILLELLDLSKASIDACFLTRPRIRPRTQRNWPSLWRCLLSGASRASCPGIFQRTPSSGGCASTMDGRTISWPIYALSITV
jgi:hypothetical protein